MLQTKPQGQWPIGSGEEDFWRVLPYGRDGQHGHVTKTPRTNFRSPDPCRLHIKFGFDWPSGFGEENGGRTTSNGRRTTDNGQRTDDGAYLYYKLTNAPKGSGELKIISSDAIRGMKLKLCRNFAGILTECFLKYLLSFTKQKKVVQIPYFDLLPWQLKVLNFKLSFYSCSLRWALWPMGLWLQI